MDTVVWLHYTQHGLADVQTREKLHKSLTDPLITPRVWSPHVTVLASRVCCARRPLVAPPCPPPRRPPYPAPARGVHHLVRAYSCACVSGCVRRILVRACVRGGLRGCVRRCVSALGLRTVRRAAPVPPAGAGVAGAEVSSCRRGFAGRATGKLLVRRSGRGGGGGARVMCRVVRLCVCTS